MLQRIRVGTETWIRALWLTLKRQYGTGDVQVMATAVREVMCSKGSSCIYKLFSFHTATQYVGLVHERPAILRAGEHWEAIGGTPTKPYHSGMRRTGGCKQWYLIYLPYIVCEGGVPLKQLVKVETREIQAHPKLWNKAGRRVTKPQGWTKPHEQEISASK